MTEKSLVAQAIKMISDQDMCHWSDAHDRVTLAALREYDWSAADSAYDYALNLAMAIYRDEYAEKAPDWKPLPDLLGLLTQIDNMVAGLRKPSKAEWEETDTGCARVISRKTAKEGAGQVEAAPGWSAEELDRMLDEALADRDRYHEAADDLAAQIAAITGEEIGEHSSDNDPWRNAMLAADDFIAVQIRKLCTPPASPSEGGGEQIAHIKQAIYTISGGDFDATDDEARRIAEAVLSLGEPAWVDLTDDDRERAMNSMPDMLEGFMKTWGWLHFAKAIEAICKEKNQGAPK